MQPIVEHISAKTIIGMSLRTNNERESHPETASIPIMWKNFFEYNVMAAVPQQLDPMTVYGVYYDYEPDVMGDYTLLIGLQSGSTDKPSNLNLIDIKEGKYLVFKVLEATPTGIKDTWAGIDGYFAQEGEYQRAYATDFEIYQGKSDISIYLSIL
ncbi:MAG: GyrI-like domain-containing protein [Sulfuricurvum sp.]|nr:GyrI-like domain-containing protein [Sulfuricurvum sp.]